MKKLLGPHRPHVGHSQLLAGHSQLFVGITVLSFFYVCLDRVPARLYGGALSKLPLGRLLKYGYTSTEKRPILSDEMIREENDWRTTTYNHFYGNDR